MKGYLNGIDRSGAGSELEGELFNLYKIKPGLALNDNSDCTYPLILHKGKDSGGDRLEKFKESVEFIEKHFDYFMSIIESLEVNENSIKKLHEELDKKFDPKENQSQRLKS